MRNKRKQKDLIPFNRVMFFIVYGTLQKPFRLRKQIPQLIDLGPIQVDGFDLYSLGAYPYIVANPRSGVPLQATLCFTTNPTTFKYINDVEIGAGYDVINQQFPMLREYFDIFEANNIHVDSFITHATGLMYVMTEEKHLDFIDSRNSKKVHSKNWITHYNKKRWSLYPFRIYKWFMNLIKSF